MIAPIFEDYNITPPANTSLHIAVVLRRTVNSKTILLNVLIIRFCDDFVCLLQIIISQWTDIYSLVKRRMKMFKDKGEGGGSGCVGWRGGEEVVKDGRRLRRD
jgi:hypothetical protein